MIYCYGMRLRGFSLGCQPKDGLIKHIPSEDGIYHDYLLYSRKLTAEECSAYELDYIGEVAENDY